MSHAFEGPEKKLEINLVEGQTSLRLWGDELWSEVVKKSNACILSKVSSDSCDAYLLSESSLMVWDDCLLMITCGTTSLVSAAEFLIDKIGKENIEHLFFERKNEYFPFAQKSDFQSDVKKLREFIPGKAYQFGRPDEHHIYLFASDPKSKPKKLENTLEILMYDLDGKACEVFQAPNLTAEQIRERTAIDRILPDYKIDDYSFSPVGYSLNALKDSFYYTIHVTPQAHCPYVSFETNQASCKEVKGVIQSVLETFQPRSFDIMFFAAKEEIIDLKGYEKRSAVSADLFDGLSAQYGHFSKSSYEQQKPLILDF